MNGRSIPCWLRCPPTLENIGEQSRGADANDGGVHEARTVKGGPFRFAGNLGAGIEIFNTKRIRKEIDEHKALQ